MYAKVSREINWIEETIAKTIPRTAENFLDFLEKIKSVTEVGFEPTPPKRLEP